MIYMTLPGNALEEWQLKQCPGMDSLQFIGDISKAGKTIKALGLIIFYSNYNITYGLYNIIFILQKQ